jgi:hypothetical protein
MRNTPIATAWPWPLDVLALSFYAPADWRIASALNLHLKGGARLCSLCALRARSLPAGVKINFIGPTIKRSA